MNNISENKKKILRTLTWIDTIQAHDGASIATAEHRAGLKLLADEFCAAIEELRQLRAKLSRKAGDGRKKTGPKEKPRCKHGRLDTPSNRKRSPAHECWK